MLGGGTLLVWGAGCSGAEVVPEAAMPRIWSETDESRGQSDQLWCGADHV